MKITLGQAIIALIFTGIAYANEGKAQVTLDKPVTLTVSNTSLSGALKKLEKSADVKFVYSKSIIQIDQQVSINARQERLQSVLDKLLVPNGIKYEVIDDRIVLIKNQTQALPAKVPVQKAAENPVKSSVQVFTVKGQVKDSTGATLPGVGILLKGTSTGVATDVNGNYSIDIPDGTGTLVFTYIGYATKEVNVNGQNRIDVILSATNNSLNEVVVIGYQAVKKKDLTGAVSIISAQESNRVTSSSLGESLQGLSPGVTVRNSGAPGANSEIEIRGIGSLLSSAPLYVIDGMLSDANVTINNDDIETIQILKDASAAAIYGSRAANGVIIITTKQGKNGPPKITFSVKYGQQHLPKTWNVMNSTQYAAIKQQEYINSGKDVPPSVASGTFNPAINTNWQALDERTGNDADYNITLSGGSEYSKYLVSASYLDNQSVLLANSFNRASLRINTETKKGILTFGENALLTNSNTYTPTEGNPFFDLPTSLPTVPVRSNLFVTPLNPQGYTIGTIDQGPTQDITYANNILAGNQVANQYTNNAKLVGNGFVQLQLTKWLFYKFNIGLETSFDYTKALFEGIPIRTGTPSAASTVDETRGQFTNLLMEHTLNFNKSFGVHNINGVFGFTQQREKDTYTSAGRTNLTSVDGQYLTSNNSATGDPTSSGGIGFADFKIISYLGRVNYTFNDKYLLTATGRVDQDSRFGANYRTGFFPSVAGAWRLNKESFFKADWINDLKLSASYGVLGVNTIPQFANQGYVNTAPRAVFNGDAVQNGAYQASLYNPDVHWESRHETNIGLDATILNNKVIISAAVYRNVSKDALLIEQLPGYLGANDDPYVNAGSIRNEGIELSATYRNNNNKLKWSITGNITTIKNKVLSVGDQGGSNYIVQGDLTRAQIGHPIGSWYVLKDLGLFQNQVEIDNYKRANGDVIEPFAKPGDVKFYADPNGTGSIGNNDRVFDGTSLPNLQTGLQFNANYKQFSINIQLVGIFGFTIFDAVRESLDSYQNSNFRSTISPWTPTNTNTQDPRLGVATDQGIAINNTNASSRWLENGSYGRIRNLEFGYGLPKTILSKWHVDNVRIFISGQNLLTVTKYKGLDPDVQGNLLQPGYDNGGWPPSRVYSIGINCGF